MPMSTSPKTLKAITCGDGSFLHFLRTSEGPRHENIREYLISPFKEAMGEDGCLRSCKVADMDDWERAIQRVERQSMLLGGPQCKYLGCGGGVMVGGSAVYDKKRVVC